MKKGELVRLKTGGTSMLVVGVERPRDPRAELMADCVWEEGNAVQHRKFPVPELETVDDLEFCMGAERGGLD